MGTQGARARFEEASRKAKSRKRRSSTWVPVVSSREAYKDLGIYDTDLAYITSLSHMLCRHAYPLVSLGL